MKKIGCLFIFIFYFSLLYGQEIICPDDVTINSSLIDPNHKYGEPIINYNEPYTLKENIETDFIDCDEMFLTIIHKEFQLANDESDIASCNQAISITRSDFSDFSIPEDITIEYANPFDLHTDLTGSTNTLPPSEYTSFYEDRTQKMSNEIFTVKRTWHLKNACTSVTKKYIQNILINNANVKRFSSGQISDINNMPVQYSIFSIKDETGAIINDPTCFSVDKPLHEILNCIYDNNSEVKSLRIEVIKNQYYLNGVSTLDLVFIIKHILQERPFENYTQVIAAQLNEDKKITGIDITELRKLILGVSLELSAHRSWVFFHNSVLQANKSTDLRNYDLTFNAYEFPLDEFYILAIKKGDVTGNAVTHE